MNVVSVLYNEMVWQRLKSQGDKWRYGYVQLPAVTDSLSSATGPVGKYSVVFKSVRGQGYRGDVALDDISARPGSCPPQGQYAVTVLIVKYFPCFS